MLRNKNLIDYSLYEIGYNYRLTDIQCALGISQLKRLKFFIKKRRSIAKKYNNFLKNIILLKFRWKKNFASILITCTHF